VQYAALRQLQHLQELVLGGTPDEALAAEIGALRALRRVVVAPGDDSPQGAPFRRGLPLKWMGHSLVV
jgi:hypothetical protein